MGDTITSLHLVELRGVVSEVVRQAHDGLVSVATKLPPLDDDDRKRALLLELHAAQQQLQRLGVVVGWSAKARAVAECRRVLEAATLHATALQDTADQLAYLHSELTMTAPPAYDVATALHVLQHGSYDLLPTCIEEEAGMAGPLPGPAPVQAAVGEIEFLIRSMLLHDPMPAGVGVVRVENGVLTLVSGKGSYAAELTLVPAPEPGVTLAQYGGADGEGSSRAVPAHFGAKPITEIDEVVASASAGASESLLAGQLVRSAEGGPPGAEAPEGWRWRLLKVALMSGCIETPLSSPLESESLPLSDALQAWICALAEQQMWAAADMAVLRGVGRLGLVSFPSATAAAGPRRGGPGAASPAPSASVMGAASAVDADSADAEVPSWRWRPLEALDRLLGRAAARAALGALVVPGLRGLEGAEPWKGNVRVDRARAGTGISLVFWMHVPSPTGRDQEAMAGPCLADVAPLASAPTAPHAVEIRLDEMAGNRLRVSVSPPCLAWPEAELEPAAVDLMAIVRAALDAAAEAHLRLLRRALEGRRFRCALRGSGTDDAAQSGSDGAPEKPGGPGGRWSAAWFAGLPRLCRPCLEVWATTPDGAGAPDAVLAIESATGFVVAVPNGGTDAPDGTAVAPRGIVGALVGPDHAPNTRATAHVARRSPLGCGAPADAETLREALRVANAECSAGPLPVEYATRLELRAGLVAAVVDRRREAREAARRVEEAAAALAATTGPPNRPPLAATARRIPAALLQTALTLDGGQDAGADALVASLRPSAGTESVPILAADLACFPADPRLALATRSWLRASARPFGGPAPSALVSSTGLVGTTLLLRAEPNRAVLAAELLVQTATARGVRLRTAHVLRVPQGVCLSAAGEGAADRRSPEARGLKRGRGDEAACGHVPTVNGHHDEEQTPAARGAEDESRELRGSDRRSPPSPVTLEAALLLARRTQCWSQLVGQLQLLGLDPAEEWRLGGCRGGALRSAVVPCPGGLAALDRLADAAGARHGDGDGEAGRTSRSDADKPKPGHENRGGDCNMAFRVDDAGAWSAAVTSCYFADWQRHLRRLGVPALERSDETPIEPSPPVLPGAATAARAHGTPCEASRCDQDPGSGLVLSGDFAKGQSLLPAVQALLGAIRLHLCVQRVAGQCAAAARPAATARSLGRGGADLINGDGINPLGMMTEPDTVYRQQRRSKSPSVAWELPGCPFRCRVVAAGLCELRLVVEEEEDEAPRLDAVVEGHAGGKTGVDGDEPYLRARPVLSVVVSWTGVDNAASQPPSTGEGAKADEEAAVQQGRRGVASGRAAGDAAHVRRAARGMVACRVTSDPPLPSRLTGGLEAALEAGEEPRFLDALCAACPLVLRLLPGLGTKAQRAAGLLPRALRRLEPPEPSRRRSSGRADGPPAPLGASLCAPIAHSTVFQVVQGARAVCVSIAGFAGGLARVEAIRLSGPDTVPAVLNGTGVGAAEPPDWFHELTRADNVTKSATAGESAGPPGDVTSATRGNPAAARGRHVVLWMPHTQVIEFVGNVLGAVAGGMLSSSEG